MEYGSAELISENWYQTKSNPQTYHSIHHSSNDMLPRTKNNHKIHTEAVRSYEIKAIPSKDYISKNVGNITNPISKYNTELCILAWKQRNQQKKLRSV